MKKIIVFFTIILGIVSMTFIAYANYKVGQSQIKKDNLEYEYCYNKEIDGAYLATIINKAIDNNNKFEIKKDKNGKFIANSESSIKIYIYMTDTEKTYEMETIYDGGIDNFVKNFNIIKFNCTKINYHNNGRIKSMLFEQIQ